MARQPNKVANFGSLFLVFQFVLFFLICVSLENKLNGLITVFGARDRNGIVRFAVLQRKWLDSFEH